MTIKKVIMGVLSLALVLGFEVFVYSQTKDNPTLSTSVKELKAKVQVGDYNSIVEAGKSKDVKIIAYLQELSSDSESRAVQSSSAYIAHIMLAKMGDKAALQQIFDEIDSDDYFKEIAGMRKLSQVGGKEALRKFYVLLDDTRLPKDFNEICSFPISRSSMAVGLLSRMMIENAPTKGHAYGTDKEIKIWKTWFEQSKQLIE